MLQLHRSHRLEDLAEALASVLAQPTGDPFQPEWVVVHGRPMEQWLRGQLAQRMGVCANVRFLSPTTLLEEVVGATLGTTAHDARAWRPERLTWRVLAALPALLDAPAFAAVRAYLRGSDPGSARAVALAGRMGECLARYAIVDPDRVRRWDVGEDGGDGWQPVLWRALGASGPRHLADLAHAAERRLREVGRPADLPARIAWLAEPPVAPLHARAVAALARGGVDVHALVRAPHPAASAAPRHPLLRSLGRLAVDADTVIADACAALGVVPNENPRAGTPDTSSSLLVTLQRDVTTDAPRGPGGAPPLRVASDDASLAVHVCHGAMRQAEVLRDVLLGLFDAHADLQPRDVLVLTPDVPTHAPLVESALNRTAGGPAIPVRVVDHPARRTNVVADVALRVLALGSARVDAVAVLDLVTLPAVAARFGLGAGAEDTLRRWVRESAVRWGIDEDDRASHALPRDEEHTWRFGLERLLLGWGMPGDGQRTFGGRLPYDEIEGGDAELLGRFAEACKRVFDGVRDVRAARSMEDWRRTILAIVERLVDDADTLTVPRRAVDRVLDALVEDAAVFEAPITAAAVRALLEGRFAEPVGSGGAAGAVTVAALRAGRVVPARVVVLLGVDEGVFPRRRTGIGFDLLARGPGAPDPGAEDRLCALDALLSAREHLVILYAGRTLDTNEAVAPSVPIGELLDAIDAGFVAGDGTRAVRAAIEVAHPMQPFSPRAFDGASVPRSHDARHLAGARTLRGTRVGPPAFLARPLGGATAGHEASGTVHVEDLARFLAEPAKELVGRRLGVWLDEPDTLDVRDPLDLDALAAHRVRATLLDRLLDGADADDALADDALADDALADDALALLRAAGALPHGPLGEVTFRGVRRDALVVARAARALRTGEPSDPVSIDVAIGGRRLVGRVGPLWNDGLVEVHVGRVRPKHLARAWVRHLALHAARPDEAKASHLVGMPDDKGRHTHRLGVPDDAVSLLGTLLALFDRGRVERLPLLPAAGHAYASALREAARDAGHAAGMDAAWNALVPASPRAFGEMHDGYVERLHRGADPLPEDTFPALARSVWTPLLDHYQLLAR